MSSIYSHQVNTDMYNVHSVHNNYCIAVGLPPIFSVHFIQMPVQFITWSRVRLYVYILETHFSEENFTSHSNISNHTHSNQN